MSGKKTPRQLAVYVLKRVFETDSFAENLLDFGFRRFSFSTQDRKFASELTYGTLRWKGYLDYVLKNVYHGKWLELPADVRRILETALYQIHFMDGVPDHAAVHESVNLAKQSGAGDWSNVVNGMLRSILRNRELLKPPVSKNDPIESLSVKWSHPKWLVEKWIHAFGVKRTESICRANNIKPDINLRVNRIRTNPEDILDALRKLDYNAKKSSLLNSFISLKGGSGIIHTDLFMNGLITVQDTSAGLVGLLVDPKPGEIILDMASAPGGKATHLSELSHNQARVIAVDINRNRLEKVKDNKKRLQLQNIYPVVGDGRNVNFRPVDKVLLDAPCSGLGVIRRRGELRWKRMPEQIPSLNRIQCELLLAAASLLKEGGILVYSTCSVLPEENREIVESFMQNNPDFVIENAGAFVPEKIVTDKGYIETWTDMHGIDGSFAVRFKKI